MKVRSIVACSVLSLGILAGCTGGITASAEEVVTNMLASEQDTQRFYAESTLKMYENDELTSTITMQEFVSAEKKKVITIDNETRKQSIAFNTGKELISYDAVTNEALRVDLSEEDGLPLNQSPKDQVMQMLENMKETHEYEMVGEEKVSGIDSFHIKLTPKNKSSIIGEMNLWVDKKNWFAIKTTAVNGDFLTEIEYTQIDFKPKFDDLTFAVVLPNDVEIKELDDIRNATQGTVTDAEEALGQPFLMFEDKGIESTIELDEIKGEINRTEVTVNYLKDELPYIMVSVFKQPEESGDNLGIGEEKVMIRGQEGEYLEAINGYMWDEDGLRYSVLITDPNIKAEEALTLIENMELSS